jgi:phospholipase A1
MEISIHIFTCQKVPARSVLAALLFLFLSLPFQVEGADISRKLADCTRIENDAARLKCFDSLAGRKTLPPTAPGEARLPGATVSGQAEGEPPRDLRAPSVMAKHWELDEGTRENKSIIRPYRPNYFLPVAYNSSLNQDPMLDVANNARAQHTEAKFQISFKVKLLEDILGKDVDLWFGYTQLAFWQIYNKAFSSPFREINFEPEMLLNVRTDYDILGFKGRFINLGLNHQSNGRASPLSRSWNRVMANFGFEKKNLSFLLKTWYRIPENESDDDNPDITSYMGYGELWGYYYWNKHRFAAMVRNNLRANNKGAVQLDWSFPLPLVTNDRFSGYVQYFNGYGESLIDYNKSVNRISLGFMLTDWR